MSTSSSSIEELARNSFSAGVAGACQITLMNPLDCARIRWQVAKTDSSMADFISHIVRDEGWWRGLHRPGLGLNQLCVSTVNGVRIGLYPSVRDAISPPGGTLRPDVMVISGFATGALSYFLTAPIWLMKLRHQADAQLKAGVVWPSTPIGFWLGSTALVTRGALLAAGHMTGYDSTKKIFIKREWLSDGPLLHVIAAIVGAVGATSLSAPADVLQARIQTAPQAASLASCAAAVLRDHGPLGFFRGATMNFARLSATFIIGTSIYEQVRRIFGLGYFR